MMLLANPVEIIFYVFAAIAVLSALVVITTRDPVRSVLSLVVTFFAMAGVWLLLHAEFLALILILVYVGAVMTLFLFVVMMLNVRLEEKRSTFVNYLPFALIIVLLITGIILIAVSPHYLGLHEMNSLSLHDANVNNTARLGELIYTIYAYPFEIAGVILLAAIIAAISLAQRHPRSKQQNVSAQIAVQPQDRLRLIKMPAVKKPGATST